MDESPPPAVELEYEVALRPLLAGRRVLAVFDVLAGVGAFADTLRALGVERVAALAATTGIGEVPDPADVPHRVLGAGGTTIMEGLRAFEAALVDLPSDVRDWLDEWDPHAGAWVLAAPFAGVAAVAGRPVWGARPPAWAALEDKTVTAEIWDGAGIDQAPSRVVPAPFDDLPAVVRSLDLGHGVAIAGDNTEGWHGGGEYLRWATTVGEAKAAVAEAPLARCRAVRVMPFLEGRPCSVHGYVLADRVLRFRPVEMLVLRDAGRRRIRYAGAATTWDPDDSDRDSMRRSAVRVGEFLRSRVGYRGAFSIDGVMTVDGFLPTELNPRLSVGLGVQMPPGGSLPLGLITRAVIEGHELEIDWARLERRILENADVNRRSHGFIPCPNEVAEASVNVRWQAGVPVEDPDGVGTIEVGPGANGSVMRVDPGDGTVPVGRAAAPYLAAACRFADLHWGTGFGAVEAAPDVR